MMRFALLVLALMMAGCTTAPPRNPDNICDIFKEKDDWYDDAKGAAKRWGSPIPVTMAFMKRESGFQAKAKPPRTSILWIFPGPRASSAYGYSQAKTSTWSWYKGSSGNWGADRDDFADAIDFIAWYNSITHRKNKVAQDDAYNLYLAYHEGHGGYSRGSYRNKSSLKQVAASVSSQAKRYQTQLNGCEKDLQRHGWWPF